MKYAVGIDIGSTYAKVVVIDEDKNICFTLAQPTGWSSVDTAENVRLQLEEAGFGQDYPCVATGYGRISVPYAKKTITEITCHARGACQLFGEENLTVIDIGGQDTKIIAVKDGTVQDFLMNDKCSAGTGRFLEIMAKTLELSLGELCDLARQGGGTAISSMCTVFAESEVISLIGRGEARENIALPWWSRWFKGGLAGRKVAGCGRAGMPDRRLMRMRLCERGFGKDAGQIGDYQPAWAVCRAPGAALSALKL